MEATRSLLPGLDGQIQQDGDIPSETTQQQHYTNINSPEAFSNSVNYTDEKFLGFLCKPLQSCCCGCPLQFGLKTLAIIALVLGGLGLTGSIVTLGLIPLTHSLLPLLRHTLLFGAGILLWQAAAKLNPKLAQWAIICLTGFVVIDVIAGIFTIITFTSASAQENLIENIKQQFVEKNEKPPSDDELRQTVAVFAIVVIITSSVFLLLETILYFLVYYVVWSFTVLAKRGEAYILTVGSATLPIATTGTQQTNTVPLQYAANYPQSVPNVNNTYAQQSAMDPRQPFAPGVQLTEPQPQQV